MTEKEFRKRKWKNNEVFYTVGFRFFREHLPIPYRVIRVKISLDPESSEYIRIDSCNKKYYGNNPFKYENWINTRKNNTICSFLCSYNQGFKPNEYLFKTKQEALEKLEYERQNFIANGIKEVVRLSDYIIRDAKKTIKDCRIVFRMKIFKQE